MPKSPGYNRNLEPPRGVAQLAEHRSPKPGVAGSSPAAPVAVVEPKPAPLAGFGRPGPGSHSPPKTAQDRWNLALTGAHSARESEIAPSSPKVRRELFEIVLQEQIFFAAR